MSPMFNFLRRKRRESPPLSRTPSTAYSAGYSVPRTIDPIPEEDEDDEPRSVTARSMTARSATARSATAPPTIVQQDAPKKKKGGLFRNLLRKKKRPPAPSAVVTQTVESPSLTEAALHHHASLEDRRAPAIEPILHDTHAHAQPTMIDHHPTLLDHPPTVVADEAYMHHVPPVEQPYRRPPTEAYYADPYSGEDRASVTARRQHLYTSHGKALDLGPMRIELANAEKHHIQVLSDHHPNPTRGYYGTGDPHRPVILLVDEGAEVEIGNEQEGFMPYDHYLEQVQRPPTPKEEMYIVPPGARAIFQDHLGNVLHRVGFGDETDGATEHHIVTPSHHTMGTPMVHPVGTPSVHQSVAPSRQTHVTAVGATPPAVLRSAHGSAAPSVVQSVVSRAPTTHSAHREPSVVQSVATSHVPSRTASKAPTIARDFAHPERTRSPSIEYAESTHGSELHDAGPRRATPSVRIVSPGGSRRAPTKASSDTSSRKEGSRHSGLHVDWS